MYLSDAVDIVITVNPKCIGRNAHAMVPYAACALAVTSSDRSASYTNTLDYMQVDRAAELVDQSSICSYQCPGVVL